MSSPNGTIDLMVKPVPVEEQPHQVGHKIWLPAYEIDPNEKALMLVERNEQAPDSKGFRRYQTIFVTRKDKLAKFMGDMGLETLFRTPPFNVLSGDPAKPVTEWAHTVAELWDLADEMREHLLEKESQQGRLIPPDLLQQYADELDQLRMVRRGQRWFGPNGR